MGTPSLLDRNGLLTCWRRLGADARWAAPDGHERYEVDEAGEAVIQSPPSARRQIVLTDAYCQLTEQIGHLAVMSAAVTTPSYGIRIADVVWMPCEKWETFDRDAPVPFVPDLCVEVLLDRDRRDDVERRLAAYFEGGCSEAILVDAHGQVQFWGPGGRRPASVFGIVLAFDPLYFELAHGAAADLPGRDARFGR